MCSGGDISTKQQCCQEFVGGIVVVVLGFVSAKGVVGKMTVVDKEARMEFEVVEELAVVGRMGYYVVIFVDEEELAIDGKVVTDYPEICVGEVVVVVIGLGYFVVDVVGEVVKMACEYVVEVVMRIVVVVIVDFLAIDVKT